MKPGSFLQHFKGGRYVVLHLATLADKELTPVVVYQSLQDDRIWVRPSYELSEEVRWPDGFNRPRFVVEDSLAACRPAL